MSEPTNGRRKEETNEPTYERTTTTTRNANEDGGRAGYTCERGSRASSLKTEATR